MGLNVIDYLFLYSLLSTWLLLLMNIFLTFSGYRFYMTFLNKKIDILKEMKEFPSVSILIPAHNEEKVIDKTIRAMLSLNYPEDKLEVIVINDNSSDNTGKILEELKKSYSNRNLKIITTDKITGGKGKSNALNIGYKNSKGDYIVVYDADNTPEKLALRYLVYSITNSKELGAVIGKFRTRNKNKNFLTRFINIETLSFQWMAQAGRWKLFRLCTIPGTNFIIRRSILEKLGGWDINAIAEDTEISFRIYKMGYRIGFMPLAVTWEQEPEKLKVWFKQRTRWAKGNIYVLVKYLRNIYKEKTKSVLFDLYYFFSVYFLFLSSVILSDIIFILGLFTNIKISLSGSFFIIWILAYVLFILEVSITLTMEKGESNFKNILLVALMYFSYCQLWMIVAVKGVVLYFKDVLLGREAQWYKTERF
ncbi:Glycosyltransferase, catalytic subunit of cellulose synthase and poly-beta-1,6-N-acetylglucosamine synthase [Caminicella sporogenes DSM 14501]|uniref:Glycosyltransferase, catalytic subunit of cellulose synthase and poly-beta-1,6-N-acetylglucosamine synthase n=1 Tax=Caminicella sporogenes DSM 14501 TaxID=1121266 RepID=A0A1M6Q9H4_9FIRM|nr:glycosyltransferase [Caminicella sporogenes]RKD23627.1 glycosyl transferase family 2 [Caminicella sporogenes]SHK16805.1 Glycosyltransferase, catalytic subunit of cellulose synthase and poly-beta-1,6-N-acetylglucosamine synthase [Caminicella sporogenes DSM 14501]